MVFYCSFFFTAPFILSLQNTENVNYYSEIFDSLMCLCTATTPSVKICFQNIYIIQQGKLAKELDFVSHHVRTKLDELKRQEVNRLRTLIKAKQDLEGGNGMSCNKIYILVFYL